MSSAAYRALAAYYDRLNAEVDYNAWAELFLRTCRKYGGFTPERVIDLGCGTGNMTLALLRRGLSVTGIDLSAEMLSEAYRKATDEGYLPLLLCQDMCDFEVYAGARADESGFDAVVSTLDCINYLPDTKALRRCFRRVRASLREGGIFLFDVNTPHKFRTLYGDRAYLIEADGVVCTWQNHFSPSRGTCRFDLSLFVEEKDGRYVRLDEVQYERMYARRTLEQLLAECGFAVCDVTADFDFTKAGEQDERWFFTACAR